MAFNLKKLNIPEKMRNQLIGAVAIAVLVGVGYWYFFYVPNTKIIVQKTKLLEGKRKDLEEARNMVVNYPEYLREASSINRHIEFINSRLPKTFSIGEAIDSISEKANEAGIKITKFTPDNKPVKKGEYTEQSVKLEIVTNFENLGVFMTGLGYIQGIVLADEVSIKLQQDKASDTDPLKVSMSIKLFTYNE
jgi:Tfp pilus assembly protein PilO